MEEYAPLAGLKDATHYFTGKRGSIYAAHPDASTTGYREPTDMTGTGQQMQPRSSKTYYADFKNALAIQDWMSNENIGTRLLPQMGEDGKPNALQVQMTQAHPRRKEKVGDIVATVPISAVPKEGLHPIELMQSSRFGVGESPAGTRGKYHIGSQIEKVLPLVGGKGGYRPGIDNLQHSLNPLKMAMGGSVELPSDYRAGGRVRMI
jgi:hypothetical protein